MFHSRQERNFFPPFPLCYIVLFYPGFKQCSGGKGNFIFRLYTVQPYTHCLISLNFCVVFKNQPILPSLLSEDTRTVFLDIRHITLFEIIAPSFHIMQLSFPKRQDSNGEKKVSASKKERKSQGKIRKSKRQRGGVKDRLLILLKFVFTVINLQDALFTAIIIRCARICQEITSVGKKWTVRSTV